MAAATTRRTHARSATLVEAGLDEIVHRLERARRSALIASPFISTDVAAVLADAADDGRVPDRRLLTALNHGALASGFLSVEGLRLLEGRNFVLSSLLNLHAKVVLIDDWGLVGSGNLTAAGVDGGNAELGVALSRGQVREAREVFERWWDKARDVGKAELASAARAAKRLGPPKSPTGGGTGGRYRVPAGDALARRQARYGDLRGRGLWLKPVHRRAEHDDPGWWRTVTGITDPHSMRDGRMIGRPGYQPDDLLLVYISRTLRCPAILRVTDPPREDLKRAQAEPDPADRKRGWLTAVEPVVGCDLDDAPDIDTIGIPRFLVMRRPRLR